MHNTFLYFFGFFVVLLFIFFGIDDVVWDLISLSSKRAYRKRHIDFSELEATPPKKIALSIACWHEQNVIEKMVANLICTSCYPHSMYDVFLGVYPNDPETIEAVRRLEREYPNVHVVINSKNGPTSKAQNLNHVLRRIRAFEAEQGINFEAFSFHDSEDVVHPYELLMTNYLIDQHDAIQFPVFPYLKPTTFKNFFKNMTTATYADEFAENHFSTLVGRYSTGAFVPSAGTGFSLSRKAVLAFGDEDLMPTDALTEDYRLALTLYERGLQFYYILEKIPRVDANGKILWDYISTRSIFPKTFKEAVRQKTRWVYGITMQSLRHRELSKYKLPQTGRYSIYKDSKAKYGNLVLLPGYAVMIYWIMSFFIPLPPIYRAGTIPYYLCYVVTAMMLIRQFYRGVALTNVYGKREMFFACLLPPIFPLRLIYGNILNLVATTKAFYRRNYARRLDKLREEAIHAPDASAKGGKHVPSGHTWNKTDHEFVDVSELEKNRRTLTDTLILRGVLSADQVSDAVQGAKEKGQKLSSYLIENGLATEQQILSALAMVRHTLFISDELADQLRPELDIADYSPDKLRRLQALPLIKEGDAVLSAVCSESPANAVFALNPDGRSREVYMSREQLFRLMDSTPEDGPYFLQESARLHREGKLSGEQLLLVGGCCVRLGVKEDAMLRYMGLLPAAQEKAAENAETEAATREPVSAGV